MAVYKKHFVEIQLKAEKLTLLVLFYLHGHFDHFISN